jgi:hypothetical protein
MAAVLKEEVGSLQVPECQPREWDIGPVPRHELLPARHVQADTKG